jgi:hypothetical protein
VVPIPSLQRLFDRSYVLGFVGALWAQRTLVSVPRFASSFIVTLRKRGPTAIHDRRPRSGRVSDQETDPEIRPEEITFLTVSFRWDATQIHEDHRAMCGD